MKKQIVLKKNDSDYKLVYNDKEIIIKNNVKLNLKSHIFLFLHKLL